VSSAHDIREAARALASPTLIKARGLLRQGNHDAAGRELEACLHAEPDNSVAHCMRGEIALRQSAFADAEAYFLSAAALNPSYLEALHGLGFARYSQMRLSDATGPIDKMLGLDPTNLPARLLRAAISAQCGENELALLLYRGIVGERSDLLPAWLGLGHSERILGNVEAAVTAYRQVLRIDPHLGEAWGHMANIKTLTFAPADIAAMKALAAQPDLSEHHRIFVEFALGKAFYDTGDDRTAFHHYREGNALAKRAAPVNASHDTSWRSGWIDRQLATFPQRSAIDPPLPDNSPEQRPIFVVGLPRSGTTLVEQILGSHSLIEATSELPYMTALAHRLNQEGGDLASINRESLRAEYFRHATAHRRTDRPCFIDKMPGNFVHVPLIRTLFPEGAIIDVRRHPLASCVSVFRQHLIGAPEYAGTLADIAKAWRFYAETMTRIDTALPRAVHRLHYESLVEETEAEVVRLFNHIGVSFEERCLRWYESARAVQTPSSEQVRQPIYRKGLDAWRRFEMELGEAREVLAAEIARYPSAGAATEPLS
jgi:tetratricopeptide (TPR) repeat protein